MLNFRREINEIMTCIEGAVIAGLDKIGDVVRKN